MTMSPAELKLVSVATETMIVVHHFSQKQIEERRKKISDLSVDLMGHEDAWKSTKEAHESLVKPIKEELGVTIRELGRGFEEKREIVHLVPDQEKGVMDYVTEDGVIAKSRPLLPAERQLTVFHRAKEGTND
jgi:hypothetical protein